nr:hypothetical protein [Tanacetum cinerariifolium]
AIVDIDLLLGEHLDTLSTGDSEIDFNPSMDIEELECLLPDDPVPVPWVFDEPLAWYGFSKITKKGSKPDKNEHEIVKNAQKPDPKTFSVY